MKKGEAEQIVLSLRETLKLSYSKAEVAEIEFHVQHLLLLVAEAGAPTSSLLFIEALRSVATIFETAHGLRKT